MRGRGFRGSVQRGDMFRSRPPNTSRPPSLHVDDFVALETCGQQPTGPTGYNKISMRVAQVKCLGIVSTSEFYALTKFSFFIICSLFHFYCSCTNVVLKNVHYILSIIKTKLL